VVQEHVVPCSSVLTWVKRTKPFIADSCGCVMYWRWSQWATAWPSFSD